MAADQQRRGDLDGRGNLSQAALIEFCQFFLSVCVDQVDYMRSILRAIGAATQNGDIRRRGSAGGPLAER